MRTVAGIDSSTQSCKIVVCDTDTGDILREGRAGHPDGTEVDPEEWWAALQEADRGLLDDVDAVAVAGQQHGMVTLDESGTVARPALLWNDIRSAGAARALVDEFGGPEAWAGAVGSVPTASFTVTKLRWLAEHEPETARRVHTVLLPHDWLTWRLAGGSAEPTTDRGDASGTGYWSPATGDYRDDILELAFGRRPDLPRVAGPAEVVGETKAGALVAAGTGDNMGAALGLGLRPGDVVVSVGTSGTVFAASERATTDASGIVAGFADATGGYLPLVCTLNAARVLTATATMLGTDLPGLERLALEAEPGSGGVVLLPYLDGERTPDLPDASGSLTGLTRANMTQANIARAAVEGVLCGLADGLDAVRSQGVEVSRALLIGGGARSLALRSVAPSLLGVPVGVPHPGEYVAIGAARQAAWALTGERPEWSLGPPGRSGLVEPADQESGQRVRGVYADRRRTAHGR